jgi:hypothetical protein
LRARAASSDIPWNRLETRGREQPARGGRPTLAWSDWPLALIERTLWASIYSVYLAIRSVTIGDPD